MRFLKNGPVWILGLKLEVEKICQFLKQFCDQSQKLEDAGENFSLIDWQMAKIEFLSNRRETEKNMSVLKAAMLNFGWTLVEIFAQTLTKKAFRTSG